MGVVFVKKKFWKTISISSIFQTRVLRIFTVIFILFCLLIVLIIALRHYQNKTVKEIIEKYKNAKTVASSKKVVQLKNGLMLMSCPKTQIHSSNFSTAKFFRARFSRRNCQFPVIFPIIRYTRGTKAYSRLNWSRTIKIPLYNDEAILFFHAWDRFEGLVLPSDQIQCLNSVDIIEPRDSVLLLTVVLPNEEPFYKKNEKWEKNKHYFSVKPFRYSLSKLRELGKPITKDDIDKMIPSLSIRDTEWVFQGYAKIPADPHKCIYWDRSRSSLAAVWSADVSVNEIDTDILKTKPRYLTKGSIVLVEGELLNGGIQLGLVRNNTSGGSVTIVRHGRFVAFLEIPVSGTYIFGIAHKLFWYTSLENRFKIYGAYWIENMANTSQ